MSHGGSDRRVASPKTTVLGDVQARWCRPHAIHSRPPPMDRQLCPLIRICVWISVIIRVDAFHNLRAIREAEKDCASVGVYGVGWGNDVRAGRVVLRRAGVRV